LEEAESVLRASWKRLVDDHVSGKLILKTEKDMEKSMAQISKDVIAEHGFALDVCGIFKLGHLPKYAHAMS